MFSSSDQRTTNWLYFSSIAAINSKAFSLTNKAKQSKRAKEYVNYEAILGALHIVGGTTAEGTDSL